jgi:hypothetical protein
MLSDKMGVKQDLENPNYILIAIILMFYVIAILTSLGLLNHGFVTEI